MHSCSWSWRTIMQFSYIMVRSKNHCQCLIPSSHKKFACLFATCFFCVCEAKCATPTYDSRQANHNAFDMHYGTPQGQESKVCTMYVYLFDDSSSLSTICVCILFLVLANHNAFKLHYGALCCSWSWCTIIYHDAFNNCYLRAFV